MKLSTQDTAQFFRLMWGLQFYVNLERGILTGIDSPAAFAALATEDKLRCAISCGKTPS